MGFLKFSLVAIFVASAVVFFHGQELAQGDNHQEVTSTNELRQKRVDLLRQRVEKLNEIFEAGQTDEVSLCHARIDLLKVELEYEETINGKKEKINSLLVQFDKAIELAQFLADAPRRQSGNSIADAVSNLYLLKSERVRYEILLQGL